MTEDVWKVSELLLTSLFFMTKWSSTQVWNPEILVSLH